VAMQFLRPVLKQTAPDERYHRWAGSLVHDLSWDNGARRSAENKTLLSVDSSKRDGRGSPLVLIVVVHSSLGGPSVLDIVFGLGADIGRLFQTQGIHQMHERHHFRSGVLPVEQEGCGRVRKFLPDPAVCRLRKSRHPMAGCCCISPSSYGKAVQGSKSPARTISFMARMSRIAEAADSDG
jgi:hypothetical protein